VARTTLRGVKSKTANQRKRALTLSRVVMISSICLPGRENALAMGNFGKDRVIAACVDVWAPNPQGLI
jgi:hypothetical protein